MNKALISSCLVMMYLAGPLHAQSLTVTSRAEQIEEERLAKAATIPAVPPPATQALLPRTLDLIDRLFYGYPLRLRMGGLPGGSGLALGPLVQWRNDPDTTIFTTSAIGSFRKVYGGDTAVETNFANRRLSLILDGGYFNKPQFDYYGPGPDSSKADRTQFLEENTTADLALRWQPDKQRHFTAGARIGGLFVNVGPTPNDRFPSTETVFSPAETPGIDNQTNFLVSAGLIDIQYLDLANVPTSGARGTVTFEHYADLKLKGFTFNRATAQVEGYIPFFNKKRVIAMRAGTALSFKDPDQLVPFYLQPTLGGPQDLRGYRRWRFYDNNSMIFTVEYRYEVSTGFVMALFSDAGQVFSRASQISWTKMQSDVGFGLRMHARDRYGLRIDMGFSHEGFQAWLQVQNIF